MSKLLFLGYCLVLCGAVSTAYLAEKAQAEVAETVKEVQSMRLRVHKFRHDNHLYKIFDHCDKQVLAHSVFCECNIAERK